MWGDVPYFRDLPSSEVLGSIERSPVASIRKDLKADLERAASLLPSEWSGVDYGIRQKFIYTIENGQKQLQLQIKLLMVLHMR